MTNLPDLARKVSLALSGGRGIRLSAGELALLDEVCGPIMRVAALPIELPTPGPRAAYASVKRALRGIEAPWVYLVQRGDFGPIKIGRARDPDRRFASLQTSSPDPLSILATTQNYDEQELHAFYTPERIRGEWFWPSPRLLAFAQSLKADAR
jgi:hypothetical protein